MRAEQILYCLMIYSREKVLKKTFFFILLTLLKRGVGFFFLEKLCSVEFFSQLNGRKMNLREGNRVFESVVNVLQKI